MAYHHLDPTTASTIRRQNWVAGIAYRAVPVDADEPGDIDLVDRWQIRPDYPDPGDPHRG
jgi:hypothetical protein